MAGHIARWKAEHANYRKLLDLLEAQVRVFSSGGQPDYDLMANTVYYLTRDPDRSHSSREDAAFSRLVGCLPQFGELIDELVRQSLSIKRIGGVLAAYLAALAHGATVSRTALIGDVRRYVRNRRDHMDKEERELFPQLAVSLTDRDWFLVDSATHFNSDLRLEESAHAHLGAIRQKIADAMGCSCESPPTGSCCVN